ncbi:MAG: carboxypeptidase-like regulatory domain-containing protein, partial [Bacteroidales bacterium]|nr:carboxypeptidase-like regulatory domain-containing protein [Bacteroidales bacterium]
MKESCKSGYIFFGLIILLLSLWLCDIHSQSEKLNVKLVFKTTKAPLQDYINEIEEQSGLQFAYSSEKIPVKSKVTLPSKAISLNDFLILLSDEYNISNYVTGNQVVLFEKKPSEFFRISGYIADARTGEKLIAANIYNSNFEGTISNSYGFYSFNQPAADHFLNFSYVGYKPYKLNLNSLKDTFINVRLEPYLLLDEIQIIGREKSLIDESNPIQVLLP